MFIIKTRNNYVCGKPRRNKKEGLTTTTERDHPAILRFATADIARNWLKEIRQIQKSQGFKSYELARGYPIPA